MGTPASTESSSPTADLDATARRLALFDLSLSLLCTADATTGHFIDLNDSWTDVLGWSKEELCAKPFFDFLHPDDLERTQAIAAEMRDGGPAVDFENRYQHKDGSWVWLSWVGVLRSGLFYAAARDFDAYKAAEAALVARKEDLEDFAHATAHDLQEPLRAIGGYLSFLDPERLNPEDAEVLNKVNAAVDRMRNLLNGIIAFSRLGERDPDEAKSDLCVLLDEAVGNLDAVIRERDAQIELDGEWPTLRVSGPNITRVFQNVISNGIKFTPKTREPRLHCSCEQVNGQWEIRIRDEGVGFAPERAERAFRLFSRLHAEPEFEGSGIGLALCRRIMSAHGGSIRLESQPGEGTTAIVTFPRERQR